MSNTNPGSSPNNKTQSPKVDPWEARERERQRYSRPTTTSSSAWDRKAFDDIWAETDLSIRENYLVVGLLVTLVCLIGSGVPRIEDNYRYFLLEVGTFLSVLLLGTCRSFQEQITPALRRPLNITLLLVAAWTVLAFFVSPYRSFASTELMRVASGISIYFLTAYALKAPGQISLAIAGMLVMGVGLSLVDFAEIGARGGQRIINNDFSFIGTHEHVGSLLTLLLPVGLIFAIHPEIEEKRRLSATAVTIVLAAALLVSRSRSGWVATFLALIVLTVLYLRYVRPQQADDPAQSRPLYQRIILSPLTQVTVALLVFLSLTSVAPLVSQRASNLRILDDNAFTERLAMWKGAALMIGEKPLAGWGLGAFPVLQSQFTHTGDDTTVVLSTGTSHINNAHNYYLQWGVETGIIGVVLHLMVLSTFLATGFRALPTIRTPFQTALICGTMAAVLASLIESISSPMYHFAGVWSILYAWIGIGTAALRPLPGAKVVRPASLGPANQKAGRGGQFDDVFLLVSSLSFSIVVGAGIFFWTQQMILHGKRLPRGTFQIIASPIGPIPPGRSVYFRAVFTDDAGKVVTTIPGTVWYLGADQTVTAHGQQALLSLHEGETEEKTIAYPSTSLPRQSVFRLTLPLLARPSSTLTVKATYRDSYGRLYEAWSTKSVGSP